MKYCKVIEVNRAYNYNVNRLTPGKIYDIIEKSNLPNRYKIINDEGETWWVGEGINTDEEHVGITWKSMVVFFNSIPSPLEVISV